METLTETPLDDSTFAKEALYCEVGVLLQQAREMQGMSRETVIKELKFSPNFLDALESGSWHELPGEVYALGFLKQYAALLAIDIEPQIQRIKSNTFELTAPLTYPDAPISPNRTWVMIALLMFVGVFILINLIGADSDVAQQTSNPSTSAAQQAAMMKMAPIEPIELQQVEELNEPPMPSAPVKIVQPEVEKNALNKTIKPLQVATIQSQRNSAQDEQRYIFYAAHEDVWLQVFEKIDGEAPILLREALLKSGESFVIKSGAKILLTSGNPTALEVSVGSQVRYARGDLGVKGQVLKLYPIE